MPLSVFSRQRLWIEPAQPVEVLWQSVRSSVEVVGLAVRVFETVWDISIRLFCVDSSHFSVLL